VRHTAYYIGQVNGTEIDDVVLCPSTNILGVCVSRDAFPFLEIDSMNNEPGVL
jgi:hypothetical protein